MRPRIAPATLAVTVLAGLLTGCTPAPAVTQPASVQTASVQVTSSPAPSPAATVEPTTPPTPVPAPVVAQPAVPAPSTIDRSLLPWVDSFAVTPWALDGAGDAPAFELAQVGPAAAITYAAPGGKPLGMLLARTLTDSTVVPVHEVAHGGAWLRVSLPSRRALPGQGTVNGATAWIHAEDVVSLTPISTRVAVNLTTRTLTITTDGVVTFTNEVGVGTPATPTPTGTAYLVSRWSESGSLTPQVAALSFHSAVLTTFAGDEAVVAIHTYRGATTGAVSNGCIRIPDSAWAQISAVPIGTPITITEA